MLLLPRAHQHELRGCHQLRPALWHLALEGAHVSSALARQQPTLPAALLSKTPNRRPAFTIILRRSASRVAQINPQKQSMAGPSPSSPNLPLRTTLPSLTSSQPPLLHHKTLNQPTSSVPTPTAYASTPPDGRSSTKYSRTKSSPTTTCSNLKQAQERVAGLT